MREQFALGVPAVKEQDDLTFFKDWHDFIEELAGKRQLRGFAVAHDVANRHRDITDLRLVRVLMEDWHAHRQADKGMAIEIGLAIVFGVVVQDAYTVPHLAMLVSSTLSRIGSCRSASGTMASARSAKAWRMDASVTRPLPRAR